MNRYKMAVCAGLLSLVPAIASAQAVSGSLSASFDTPSGNVGIGAQPLVAFVTPSSLSVSAAAGEFAVSTGVATGKSSATSAGATSNTNFAPVAAIDIDEEGNYFTTVAFAPLNFDEMIEAAISQLCAGLTAGTTFDLETVPFRALKGINSVGGTLDENNQLGQITTTGLVGVNLNSVDVTGTATTTVTCGSVR